MQVTNRISRFLRSIPHLLRRSHDILAPFIKALRHRSRLKTGSTCLQQVLSLGDWYIWASVLTCAAVSLGSSEYLHNHPIPKPAPRASEDVHAHDDLIAKEGHNSIPLDIPDISNEVPHQVVLSPEQTKVLQMVRRGRNVFFTGSAGSLSLR